MPAGRRYRPPERSGGALSGAGGVTLSSDLAVEADNVCTTTFTGTFSGGSLLTKAGRPAPSPWPTRAPPPPARPPGGDRRNVSRGLLGPLVVKHDWLRDRRCILVPRPSPSTAIPGTGITQAFGNLELVEGGAVVQITNATNGVTLNIATLGRYFSSYGTIDFPTAGGGVTDPDIEHPGSFERNFRQDGRPSPGQIGPPWTAYRILSNCPPPLILSTISLEQHTMSMSSAADSWPRSRSTAYRFNSGGGLSVTLPAGTNLRAAVGGILVTANVGNNATTISGSGSLTTANLQNDLIVQQFNNTGTSAALIISAAIGDNYAGPVNVTKSGPGTLFLTGANSYTGQTTDNAGVLQHRVRWEHDEPLKRCPGRPPPRTSSSAAARSWPTAASRLSRQPEHRPGPIARLRVRDHGGCQWPDR